jgi:hypothetical protein
VNRHVRFSNLVNNTGPESERVRMKVQRKFSNLQQTRLFCTKAKPPQTFSGQLSFMRIPFSRDLEAVDVAISGVPFDNATTNRPGSRFGTHEKVLLNPHY